MSQQSPSHESPSHESPSHESPSPKRASSGSGSTDRPWFISQRWQQYEGEARANGLRIVSIGAFYLIHLGQYYGSEGADQRFHLLVSLLAMAWCSIAVVVHFSLRARVFPAWLPFASTICDVVFLTAALCISAGARSPLILGYPLIISLTALRFSLPLVRVATVASLVGYVCLLGCAKWPESFGLSADVDLSVPRQFQLMTLVGIGLCGVVLGQCVRRVRGLAEDFVRRVEYSRAVAAATADNRNHGAGTSADGNEPADEAEGP